MRKWEDHILITLYSILTVGQFICSFYYYWDNAWIGLKIFGWTTWILSIFFGWWPILYLRRKGGVSKGDSYTKTTQLVDSGLYAIIRHPQYTAGILFNLSLILICQHWVIICLGLPAMIMMYFDILRADEFEVEKFGEPYRMYMKKVPGINFLLGFYRWINSSRK